LRKFRVAVPITVPAIGGSTACATKKFVSASVCEVNDKVDSTGRSLEETQERPRKNEGRISEVDAKGQAAAGQSRHAANRAAVQATSAASEAARVGTEADTRFDTMDRAKRLAYEVVLSEDQGKFGKTNLPDEAKHKPDETVTSLKQDPTNIYLEIEDHTDNIDVPTVNEGRPHARRSGQTVSVRAGPDSAA
jgi:hypothetical protein